MQWWSLCFILLRLWGTSDPIRQEGTEGVGRRGSIWSDYTNTKGKGGEVKGDQFPALLRDVCSLTDLLYSTFQMLLNQSAIEAD